MLNSINDFSIDQSYKVEINEVQDKVSITLPSGLESEFVKKSVMERNFFGRGSSASDHFLKEMWPSEFSFDFHLTIEAWKDLIICERRSPFETDGLTKKEAEWAWILVNQWAASPVETKIDFLEMYSEASATFEALGWDAYLDSESQEKLTNLFSVKTPILVNYKPSMAILEFYKNIWNPIKNNLQNT